MDLFKLVAKLGLDMQEYEKGIEKAKESNKDLGSNTESATGKIQSVWSKMFSAVESDGKSKLESLSAWTLAKAKLIVDGVKNIFNKIVDLGKSAISAAADVSAEKAQFSATFEGIEEAANGVLASVEKDTGVLATRLQQVGTKAFSQFKGAGIDASSSLAMMDKYTRLAADAAAYYDITLEDADVRLRSFLRGNTEAGDSIGLFTSESQRNAKAVELYGAKWTSLTEAQKQNLMLNVAQEIYDQSGATGQAAREMDGWVNVTGNLQRVWKDVLGVIGTPIYDSLTPVVQKLTDFLSDKTIQGRLGMVAAKLGKIAGYVFDGVIDFIDKILAWSNGDEKPNDTARALFDIASAFGNIAGMIFDGVVDFIKLLFNGLDKETAENVEEFLKDFGEFVNDPFFQTAATVLGGMVTAWLAMKAPLAVVSAVLALIVTHWKDIKEWAGKALEAVKGFFTTTLPDAITSVVSGIAGWFESIKTGASNALENIKTFFETTFVDTISGILETISGWFEDIKTGADNVYTSVTTFFNETFSDPISGILNGISDAFEGVYTWAENAITSVKNFFGIEQKGIGFGGGTSVGTGGAGRSFATGLDYVPYDNFNANLHAGEAVLNRSDATAYREGRTGTGVDYAMLGQAVGAAVREALNGIGVNMDGQRVGKITAPIVSREIAREAHVRRYVTV